MLAFPCHPLAAANTKKGVFFLFLVILNMLPLGSYQGRPIFPTLAPIS